MRWAARVAHAKLVRGPFCFEPPLRDRIGYFWAFLGRSVGPAHGSGTLPLSTLSFSFLFFF